MIVICFYSFPTAFFPNPFSFQILFQLLFKLLFKQFEIQTLNQLWISQCLQPEASIQSTTHSPYTRSLFTHSVDARVTNPMDSAEQFQMETISTFNLT